MKKRILLSLVATISISFQLLATHNHSGNIVFTQTGEKSIEATIHTYTNASSVAADRDTLIICWGDGLCEKIGRNSEVFLTNDIKHNQYRLEHTYADFGSYLLSMTDPNRNGGILNVDFPNSDAVAFHLETMIELGAVENDGPVLLEHPVYTATVGTPFIHIPNPFDEDGDSIAYELTTPMDAIGSEITNYLFPQEVTGNGNSTLVLDETTGTLIWDSPELNGQYVIAILIKEYRNGQLISSMLRDILIDVAPGFTGNVPPVFTITDDEINVQAGETVQFNVQVDDTTDEVTVMASGGPFEVDPAAVFNVPAGPQSTPLTIEFIWHTTYDLGRNQPYQVVFTAVDQGDESLHWQKAVQITLQPEPAADSAPFVVEQLAVSPNPSRGTFELTVDHLGLRSGRLSVYDSAGKQVFQQSMMGSPTTSLDLGFLSDGMYYLRIMGDGVTGTGTLLIDRR